MSALDILAIGEPLYELAEAEIGGERVYRPGFGGDISNLAISAARTGARVGIFSHLGDDRFGHAFRDLWDREGIDRSTVRSPKGTKTGLYVISYGEDGHAFSYLRDGSAASRVTPEDLPLDAIGRARLIHVSGISQGISSSAADAVFAAIAHARAHDTLVSYDTNYRPALWPLDRARAVINAAMAGADIARPSLDDARELTGLQTPDEIADFYLGLGCRLVVMTLGRDGVFVATPQERRGIPPRRVDAVDATGAGDCFGGAFLAEWLRHGDPFEAAAYGNAAAALKTLGQGAVATSPKRSEVEAFIADGTLPRRSASTLALRS
ncbi:sugar kinase [Enterovirga rhinocerotis]|uniref:2-keto-3-deoxygluconate kinase n=1 Tax=Enterovirga rhinocerotis TaxID=1339210 RepID=A0A4R7BWB4_9HYPH|nr:sugar kinase [Enterovirga rhinocerotis]TDR90160.1 2-keto-3-deoxygluconate kinase [Enterovirga rhinocerotis]